MLFGNIQGLVNGTEQVVFDYEVLGVDAYTKFLLHLDNNVTDQAGKTVTNTNVTFSDSVNKFGSHAAVFNGSNAYLSVPDSADWDFGTGNFTIDFWVRFNAIDNGVYVFCEQFQDGSNYWACYINSYRLTMVFYNGAVVKGSYSASQNWVPSTNTWYHIALERNGTSAKMFIDGVSITLTEDTAFGTNDVGTLSGSLYIGARSNAFYLNGWMDEFRISKGIARWTSNFTPPTASYNEGALSSINTGNILNGDEDGWYTIFIRQIVGSGGNGCAIRLNNDSGSNYGFSGIQTNNTSVYDWSGTGQSKIYGPGGSSGNSSLYIFKLYAKSGFARIINCIGSYAINGTTVTELYVSGQVWNNTVDNLISAQFICAASDLAVGTRVTILKSNNFTNGTPTGVITTPYIKGSLVRVGSTILGSPANSVTFSGLDGDRDVIYYLSAMTKTSGATSIATEYRINNDSTSGIYGCQVLGAQNTDLRKERATSTYMLTQYVPTATGYYSHMSSILFAKQGFIRPALNFSSCNINGTTIYEINIIGGSYNKTDSNITSLVFVPSAAGNWDTGSQFELYALRPNG